MIYPLAGFIAGLIHVLSGPDHLAAVAPLAVEERRRTWLVGLLWGIGHTSGVWLVGALAFLLRGWLPVDHLSGGAERLVGVALIGIGLWGMRRALAGRINLHGHGDEQHRHFHWHSPGQAQDEHPSHRYRHASLGMGVLHGLAGTSHFLGIVPALAIPSQAAALSYLIAFGLGSIAAMGGFAWLLGMVVGVFHAGGLRAYRWLTLSCSVAALAIGGLWLVAPL